MYGAPDGLKRALDDFVSAARQQNLRLSVLLLEEQQQATVATEGQVELQTEVSEGRNPDVSLGEASQIKKLTSAAPVAGPSTSRDSSVAQVGPSQGAASREGSGLGKRSFAEQSPSSASLRAPPQPRDPVVLQLNRYDSDRLREYILSNIGPAATFQVQSQGLGQRPSLPVPQQEASAGARPVKRMSMQSLDDGLSTKRTRIGHVEEVQPARRPMSMPAIRTPVQSDPIGHSFQPSRTVPKFWGTVLVAGQSGKPSEQFPERLAEVAGSNPADNERFLPGYQGKFEHNSNPDHPGDELKAGVSLPGTLVGRMRSRSVSIVPEPMGYPRQPTPLKSPSTRGASPSLHTGSPSFRLDPKGAEPLYRDVGTGDRHRDTVSSRDPSQPPSIFDSRAQFPRPSRMEISPAHSPFPTSGKSISALPPLGRDFSGLPTSHRAGSASSPVEGMARQADLSTGPHQPSLPSLARALSAHQPQQLPLQRSIHESDSAAMGAGDARTGGMLSRASAPSGALGGFGGRREGIRLPTQQPDTLHGPVKYVSTANRSGNVMPRTMSSGEQAFSCPQPQCEATFRRRSDMNRHVRVVHEKQRPFQCETCSNRFGEKSNMIKHIRMVHQNIREFLCQHCGAAFGQRGNCENHVRAVHEKRPGKYSCEHCNRSFSRKAQLVEHHSQEHPDLPMPQTRTRSRGGPSGVVTAPPQSTAGSQQRIPVLRNPSVSPVAAQVYETAARSLLNSPRGFRHQFQMQRQQHVQQQRNPSQNLPSQWIPPAEQQRQLQPATMQGNVQDEQARIQAQPGKSGSGAYGMEPKRG